jgi:hypothetical protein
MAGGRQAEDDLLWREGRGGKRGGWGIGVVDERRERRGRGREKEEAARWRWRWIRLWKKEIRVDVDGPV